VYDAIVIGARCAGSPTGMLLARKCYRVLLLDRATFPSDTMSTHAVKGAGAIQLHDWGMLDQVHSTNCPPLVNFRFDLGPFALTGSPPLPDDVGGAYAPRRTRLDKILVDAAVAADAELREDFPVSEVTTDNGRVTGIRGHASGGTLVTEQGRIVIGADGMRSLLARTVQPPTYNTKPPLSCAYYSCWSGIPLDGVEFYPREHRMVLTFPTNDDLAVIYAAWPIQEFHAVRADIEGSFHRALDLAPSLAERVRNGKREVRFVGTATLPNFFRKPYGPGWALVGDAGCHKDPITAQGITDAFRDAELLAEAIDAGFSGRRPLEEALAGYERQRNEAAMPIYELTCQFATLEPPAPEMQQLFGALLENQEETDRFFGTIEETVPIPEFFSPENVQRIISAA
jgi:flavin-dependent dehydrogenase